MDLRMCFLQFSRKFWCPGILGLVETDNTITKKKKKHFENNTFFK